MKFMYSEKATNFCEISTLLLYYAVPVKSKVEISQNFVAFSEYMNYKKMFTIYHIALNCGGYYKIRGKNKLAVNFTTTS